MTLRCSIALLAVGMVSLRGTIGSLVGKIGGPLTTDGEGAHAYLVVVVALSSSSTTKQRWPLYK